MAQKRYTLKNLGCASCAVKMEERINDLPGVEATINKATNTLTIIAEHPDALLPRLQQIVSSVEPDCIVSAYVHDHRTSDHDHHHNHDHDHHHDHGDSDQTYGLKALFLGLGLLVAGLALDAIGAVLFTFHLSVLAYLMAYLLLGSQVLITAYKSLKNGHFLDENFLMGIATVGAMCINQFPEAVGVMLFYRVGEYFEERAVARSRKEILRAGDLRPDTVTLENGQEIPAADAKPGQLLLVRPGDRIGLDCQVISGTGRIDTAALTGEPVPATIKPGDTVLSGCVNLSAQLVLKVEKPLEESTVTRILHAMESAAAGKPQIDRFITRFSKFYTPAVVIAAVLLAVLPSLITGDWRYWVYTALSFLVMSCPCALVLSVPLAFFSGIGAAGKKGVLFKDGAAMEALASIKTVAMDKTGTVTKGEFTVQPCDPELLRLCAACEQSSTHPIAQSIVAAAKERLLQLTLPEALEEFPGFGVRALLGGREILCGNENLLEKYGISAPAVEETGVAIHIGADGRYLGHILVADAVKTGAPRAINAIRKMGIDLAILTGDRKENADAVAKTVGVEKVYSSLLPQDKLETVRQLRAENGSVMFVGDGINDAPVLAGADVGAAIGSGADAAIEAADVVFMTSSLSAVPLSIELARKTKTIAWQNVIFALSIKAIVMILGLLGFASMWLAVFADSGVAMLCVLNSIRILYQKK